jgi:hypothetical protein
VSRPCELLVKYAGVSGVASTDSSGLGAGNVSWPTLKKKLVNGPTVEQRKQYEELLDTLTDQATK